ncbi:NAD-dependent epimerase/dehydratase family protein [Maricaulaceae bacterium MS644]
MYVILGGRGAVGQAVCEALDVEGHAYAAPSSRDADACDADALTRACDGADAIINCIGLPYTSKIWRRDWPKVAEATVSAAERTGARLIFLDNIYMYGPAPLQVPITEDHPQKPPSKKGRARKATAKILMDAHAAGRAQVTIGRAADFYGPGAVNSLLYASFLERMMQGKKPQLLMTPQARHTFAYTPDIARALIRLAGDPGAAGRAWHLPVGPATTADDWLGRFNRALGTDLHASYLGTAASRLLGAFIPLVREVHEMRYQFDSDYIFSDADFRARYRDFETTTYEDGAERTVAWAQGRG